jgi:hypothetical protein
MKQTKSPSETDLLSNIVESYSSYLSSNRSAPETAWMIARDYMMLSQQSHASAPSQPQGGYASFNQPQQQQQHQAPPQQQLEQQGGVNGSFNQQPSPQNHSQQGGLANYQQSQMPHSVQQQQQQPPQLPQQYQLQSGVQLLQQQWQQSYAHVNAPAQNTNQNNTIANGNVSLSQFPAGSSFVSLQHHGNFQSVAQHPGAQHPGAPQPQNKIGCSKTN